MTPAKACPTCGDAVPAKPIGRPLIFCSVACRREMGAMRKELVALGEAIADAEQLAAHDFWPGERSWSAEAQRRRLAAAELRTRIPEAML